ncbi:DUF3370 domain-containing protein [Egbenema bharatensis]|uniref:DUF3370 domain-containing protein n=1 Tax=Egbenema bharatensis TaxID=3463334 RepID=UPI003A874A66
MLTVLAFLSLAQIVAPIPPSSPAPSTPASSEVEPSPSPQPPELPAPSDATLPAPPALRTEPLTPPLAPSPAQVPPIQQVELVRPQAVRALPGQLDEIPVFNSNSPELVQKDGILLSTFPGDGMRNPSAHLNYPLQGRFDLFAHHIARGIDGDDVRTLFLGVIAHNPGNVPVTIDVLQAVSYLSQDAPFLDLPSYVANPMGTVYAGPGSRTTNDVLRGQRQSHWPAQITIPPGGSQLIINAPIPLRRLTVATDGSLPPGALIPPPTPPIAATATASTVGASPTPNPNPQTGAIEPPTPPNLRPSNRPVATNGRSVLMHLSSDGPVYLASLAMYAPGTPTGAERVPTLREWESLLRTGELSSPRDRIPTSPDARAFLRFFYGRVAGVARGSQWTALATDGPEVDHLTIPRPGDAFSYVLSTVDHNTFGTGQIQSAPMLVRYADTAYRAHGNYGIKYDISLPLYNDTDATQRVTIRFQTPLQDENLENGLRFRDPPDNQIFFRGTVRLRFTDDLGIPQTRYLHLVQRRGQQGEPLLRMTMRSGSRRLVEVQFIYPPDATPPQVLTVETQENPETIEASN